MKITALELFHIAIPFAKPYKLSKVYGTLVQAHAVVVKIHTDAGITGYGEADPMNPFTEETPASVLVAIRDLIGPRLLGADPRRTALLEHRLDQQVHGHLVARGAVNMALYDILGKALAVPVHDLIGGRLRDRIELMGAIGNGTPEEDRDAIEALYDQGFRTVMIKMGALPLALEGERMHAAAKRFGDRMTLIVDANQGWRFKQALGFIEDIRGAEPQLLEQPVARHDLAGLAALRERTRALVSADESVVTIQDAVELARRNAVDVFSIKASKNGGLDKSRAIARLAAAFGIRCLMNSMLEFGITQAASLQLGCTLDNLLDCGHAYMSVLRMADDITDFGSCIDNAVATVPDRPGLGIEIDEDKLHHYTLDHATVEQPRTASRIKHGDIA